MAKKAKTVSWRTLARRAGTAAKKGHKATATRLRNMSAEARRTERAAVLKPVKVPTTRRRIESLARDAHEAGLAVHISSIPTSRATKGWATRRANTMAKAMRDDRNAGLLGGLAQAGVQTATARGLPGQGEVVGGVYADLGERIAKLARKKGGMNGVYNELAALAASSKYEGSVETDKAATKRLIEVQDRLAERVVCGFIAEVNQAEAEHHGLPWNMVWSINSFTVMKIVDALNQVGYSASGVRNTSEALTVRREQGA